MTSIIKTAHIGLGRCAIGEFLLEQAQRKTDELNRNKRHQT